MLKQFKLSSVEFLDLLSDELAAAFNAGLLICLFDACTTES